MWSPVYYLDCWLSLLIVCCLPYWPRLPTGYPLCLPPALTHCSAFVYESALSTLPSILLFDICLSDLFFVLIKLQMDPNVTDPSLQKTSPKRGFSSFSKEPWPGMDPFDQLLDLKQGSSPIEEYVTQFYEISCKVPFDEVALKDIFRFGLCEPIKSYLPEGKFHCSLKDFMDYALLCAGSSFTVGVAEEEHDTALTHVMANAPEHDRKMAATTMHHQSPESHNRPAKPGPVRIMSATPESLAKMATKPADAPLRPGLIASVLDPPLVSVRAAGIPRSAALSAPSRELAESAPEPAPSRELAESAPEPAPSQELAEFAPETLLVPPSSPSSTLAPPSSPSLLVPSSLALCERPRDLAPPECPWRSRLQSAPLRWWSSSRTFWGRASRHCSLRPRIRHGPWSPPIHHGCPRPRIFYGHLENSLPLSLRLYVLSLSLVSQFPLGPSLCRGSLLRPGGRLSRLLRPGGRLSRLLRPGGRLSRLLRPGGRLSRLLRPGGRLSRWLLMDLALHSLPRFHLRSTALLDCAMCVKRLEAALWGGALSRIWLPLTTLQLHITHGLQPPSFTALRHTHFHPPLHQLHSCH